MGSIKKYDHCVQLSISAEELVAMPFSIGPGEWIVASAIARACEEKVREMGCSHPELLDLVFDRYKVAPDGGKYVVYLHIQQEKIDPLEGIYS